MKATTDQFTNIVAYAKRTAMLGELNRSNIDGLMRRAENMGLDQTEAQAIIDRTPAAKRIDPRSGDVK